MSAASTAVAACKVVILGAVRTVAVLVRIVVVQAAGTVVVQVVGIVVVQVVRTVVVLAGTAEGWSGRNDQWEVVHEAGALCYSRVSKCLRAC